MATVVERMKRYRARKRSGEFVIPVVANETLVESLVEARLLPPYADDREAIARATQKFIQLAKERTR